MFWIPLVAVTVLFGCALLLKWGLLPYLTHKPLSGVAKNTSALPVFSSTFGRLKTSGDVGFAGWTGTRNSNLDVCGYSTKENIEDFVRELDLKERPEDLRHFYSIWGRGKRFPVGVVPTEAAITDEDLCYYGQRGAHGVVRIVFDVETGAFFAHEH